MTEDRPTGPAAATLFASDVRDLLNACRVTASPKALLGNCEKLFRLLRDKKLELGVSFVPSRRTPPISRGDGHNGFVKWLQQSFQTFVSLVFELICSPDTRVQKLGLSYLFRIVKHEAQIHRSAAFPLSVYQVFIAKLLQCDGFSAYLQDVLVADYVGKYWDVRYYLLVVTGKIVREFAQRKTGAASRFVSVVEQEQQGATSDTEKEDDQLNNSETMGPEWYVWTKGEAELSRRLTRLLLRISNCFTSDGEMGTSRGKRKVVTCSEPGMDSDSDMEEQGSAESASVPKTYVDNLEKSKALQVASHRLAYQNAWLLLLLNVEHDKATTQKLLANVPRSVMPFLSNPLLLADFFLKSFRDANQLSISISALSGMFYLLAKHRLGNPDVVDKAEGLGAATEQAESAGVHFYQRLYRLITPAALAPRLRVRFLRLLNMALRSDLLPTCLVASFIKKCSRVACAVSPAATLCLEALVISLLQKYHATCKPLLSLPEHFSDRLRVAGDSFDYCTAKIREGLENSMSSDDERVEDMGEDNAVFDLVAGAVPSRLKVSKTDISPLARKQARMSLWEIDILAKHSLRSVQQLGEIFDCDIGSPAAKRVCLDDFLDITTGSLLSREFKALDKPSSAPIPAFEASTVPFDVPHLHSACMNIARQGA